MFCTWNVKSRLFLSETELEIVAYNEITWVNVGISGKVEYLM